MAPDAISAQDVSIKILRRFYLGAVLLLGSLVHFLFFNFRTFVPNSSLCLTLHIDFLAVTGTPKTLNLGMS